ncbi:hypothetical protein [Lactococcus petauri]|uniref:hypothetical protein n=1 Tax=Lactococcus petauri TaxID=1940789 RepID=UPI0025506725|nr:hypothetical protein [Lactococcus petauri]
MDSKNEILKGLIEKKNQLVHENSVLDIQIEEQQRLARKAEDEAFEMRVRALAMQEICQTTKERLFRSMGYVKSFHGYPDYGETNEKQKE